MTFQKTWLNLGWEGAEEPSLLGVPWMSLWKVLRSQNEGQQVSAQVPGFFSLSLALLGV